MGTTNLTEQFSPVYEGSFDSAQKLAKHLKAAGIPYQVHIAAESNPGFLKLLL